MHPGPFLCEFFDFSKKFSKKFGEIPFLAIFRLNLTQKTTFSSVTRKQILEFFWKFALIHAFYQLLTWRKKILKNIGSWPLFGYYDVIMGRNMGKIDIFSHLYPIKTLNLSKQSAQTVDNGSRKFLKFFSYWWHHHWWRHNGIKGGKMTENAVFWPISPSKLTNMQQWILWVVKKRSTIFLKKYPFWWRHHWWCHNGIKGGKMTGNAVFRPFSLSKWTNMPKQTLWVVENRSTIFLKKIAFWWHHHWWCQRGMKGVKWLKIVLKMG